MHTAKRAFVVCTYNHPCVLNMVSKNRLVNPEGKKEKIQCYFRYCAITLYMYIYICIWKHTKIYVFGNSYVFVRVPLKHALCLNPKLAHIT